MEAVVGGRFVPPPKKTKTKHVLKNVLNDMCSKHYMFKSEHAASPLQELE